MREALEIAINTLQAAGVDYGEARQVFRERIWNGVKNQQVEAASHSVDVGIAIRVWHQGAWGCAATQDLTPKALTAVANRAISIAKAARIVG